MGIKGLKALFEAKGIAVVGGSDHPGTVGRTVIDNLVAGGFDRPIYAVNPRQIEHPDANWVAAIDQLPDDIDLAVLCTPPGTIPDLLAELGHKAVTVAIVLTGGITTENGLRTAALSAARDAGIRLIGPNCIGLQLPHAHLNASFARQSAAPGDLAMIAQSGAIATGVVDWAERYGIGFSGVASCGDAADVDLADLIDLFAADERTRAILVHLEGIQDARRLLSAARAATRTKPVIALKAGRGDAAAKAALTHSGALAGRYDICVAALRRAGVLMVDTLSDLFSAAEMLGVARQVAGERLGIITNGGGAAVLALDALPQGGATSASLAPETIRALDRALPVGWSGANPVDILGDADAGRYRLAIEALAADPGIDALLVMNCPIGLADAAELSGEVSRVLAATRKPAFACWLGGANFDQAADDFAGARVPLFNMPEDAVRCFTHLLEARRAAAASRTALPAAPSIDMVEARSIIDAVRAEGRTMLSEPEARRLLTACGLETIPAREVASADLIPDACAALAPPYAVKIISRDGVHKSDIRGVALDLADAGAAKAAAERMATAIARDHPELRTSGFIVETMIRRAHSHELLAGIADDPTFGPVVTVGAGGKAVEIVCDRAFGLPPLDAGFARDMIDATHIAGLLHGYRDEPPAAIGAVAGVLCALSSIAVALPDIEEIDINPLLTDPTGVFIVDARIRIAARPDVRSRLAITPLPVAWSAELVTRSGMRLHVRPASPADAGLIEALFAAAAPEDLRFRFGTSRGLPPGSIGAMLDLDYGRSLTFLALGEDGAAAAAATITGCADGDDVTVALSVRADCKGRGVSWTLMEHVMRYARAQGVRTVTAMQNPDDAGAVRLEREMGFSVAAPVEDDSVRLTKAIS